MQEIIVLDTETTGVVDPIYVAEIAWCVIEEDLNVVSEFSSLINPGVPMPCSASAVNGIRDEDLVGAPKLPDIKFPDGEIILIAHNAKFDKKLVEAYMNIEGCICTLRLARTLLKDVDDYSLGALSCHCKLPKQLNHRAPNDVRDTLGLLDYFNRVFGLSLQEMYDISNTFHRLEKMPWGKHKGTVMEQVPFGYIEYMLKQGIDDEDVRYTIKQIWGV